MLSEDKLLHVSTQLKSSELYCPVVMATLVVLTRKYRYLSSRASSAYAGFSASPKASLDKNVRKKT